MQKYRVSSGGKDVLLFSANEVRNSLVVSGRHESGLCGFSIDAKMLPETARNGRSDDFRCRNRAVGVPTASKPSDIQKKLLRLEMHLFPLWEMDNALSPFVQIFFERHRNTRRETVTQLFLLNQVNSVYLSGRILRKTYASYIEDRF